MSDFDVIVIGSGPGGYVAAIRSAQLGMRVACVEKDPTLGGTCLNIGCIPSKALLTSTEKFVETQKHLAIHGIKVESVTLDLNTMMTHKNKVVQENVNGIEYLFRKNAITRLEGTAQLLDPRTVSVTTHTEKQNLSAQKAIILATGSIPSTLPNIHIDEYDILSSTGALALKQVPKSMGVIGGGYIGLEMGSVWSRLGSDVTIIESLDRILPGMDGEVSKQMQRILSRQGLKFLLSTKVMTAEKTKHGNVRVTLNHTNKNGIPETLEVEKLLVAVGRTPYTQNLGLEKVGVKQDNKHHIITDHHFRTTIPTIYAIGDVIPGPMLAHKAEEEGVACAEIIAQQAGHVNYEAIPSVVYTSPEVAQVGKTEEILKQQGYTYKVGRFPFSANARARVLTATDGFVKILADSKTDQVLGVHIVGAEAGHLIAEVAVAVEFTAAAEDLARTCHAHPTLNEAIKEAALAIDKRTIHL